MKEAVIKLCVENLSVSYSLYGKKIAAVRGVSFEIGPGEIVGLVGESGSGKTALAMSLLRLDPAQTVEGTILFGGEPIEEKNRGRDIAMIFQDPMTSLNPTMKIGDQIIEGMVFHGLASRAEAKRRALELLHLVGIPEPALRLKQYPHLLSGGMRQRAMIAIAIACNPKLLIADEPTTALDPTISMQILTLLKDLTTRLGTSLLFITHDLRAVAHACSRVLVMFDGKIVEAGSVEDIFYRPSHPYTQLLLRSLPEMKVTYDRSALPL